jgi:ribose transport system permease protein
MARIRDSIPEALQKILGADWFGALLGVAFLLVLMGLSSPYFLTPGNLTSVLVQASVVAILAVGETFVILTGNIDLSVAAVCAFSGSTAGLLIARQPIVLDPVAGICLALAIGVAVGLFNGVLIARFGLPAFVVTLAGLSLWRGVAFQVTGGLDTSPMPDMIGFIGRGQIGPVPMPIAIMLATYFASWMVLSRTRLGRYVYAIGSNEEAARLAGIPVNRYKVAVFIISGLTAGIASIVLIGRLDSSGGLMASDLELDSIAAVILGGTSLFGGRGNVWGSLLGALIMAIIRNGLNLLGVSPYLQLMFIGIVILIAMSLDVVRRRRVAR